MLDSPGGDLCRRDRSRDVSPLHVALEAALLRVRHNFYNFPYAFGHLFGLGLYAIYRREGASFVPRYHELLRATGQDYAAPLAARFGIDITRPAFWRESLQIIEGQVARFESL